MWGKVTGFLKGIKSIFGKSTEFTHFQKDLETLLITNDVHIKTAQKFVKTLHKSDKADEVIDQLKSEIFQTLKPCEKAFALPDLPLTVILICGVNGSGKTTTIAKLCHYLNRPDIGIVAADTFRAAALEQLETWGKRLKVPVYTGPLNSDPASVVYQSLEWAAQHKLGVLIIDTAGRLQNKQNLMDELSKIRRVIQKQMPDAPHETILVLDGTTGGNAITQAQIFNEVTPLSGLIMTKLDGTAKGGTLISIADLLKLPIYFLGMGEQEKDLTPFSAETFVESIL